ncbi:MAG: hypothetical protein Q8K92_12080 [Leadbetterella sp.]|nr:hypothetical protein [Leadbetterella sp.]
MDTDKILLNNLRHELKRVVAGIKELGVGVDDITCQFPADLLAGLPEQKVEIIIRVDGLFIKPERTAKVKDRLAEIVGKTVEEAFPSAFMECFVHPFDSSSGFWHAKYNYINF